MEQLIHLHGSPLNYPVKNFNKRASLDLIRFTPGGISRAEVARQIGLTRAAISSIANDLIADGLVREIENGPASGGRRPILLEFNPKRGYVIGVDMGASHLALVLADFSAQVVFELERSFDIKQGPEAGLRQVDECLRAALRHFNLSIEDILAIGLGVPGPVSAKTGMIRNPSVMPGWEGYPIHAKLVELWACPVSVDDDAGLGAIGEWAYGAGRGERYLTYIKVGSGIGAGLLLEGRIYRGQAGRAGEIGHITVRENGPLCSCGNYGCLEALAGGEAIARKARAAVQAGRRSQLGSISPLENISAEDVAAAARLGDLVAQRIMTEAGVYLGIAVAGLVNILNPGMVVIGGGVAQVGDLLLEPVRQSVRERSLRSAAQAVRITSAVLGRRSTSMGAVVQALNSALDRLTEPA
jgi:glucokinase-like ROK family protein